MNRRALFTSGGVAALVGAALVVPATAQAGTASAQFVHGLPVPAVDVCVDGDLKFDGVAPETRSEAVALAAGERAVKLVAADAENCEAEALAQGTVTATADTDIDLVAHLDDEGSNTVSVFTNDLAKTAAGHGRVDVRHAADAGALDARLNDTVIAEGLINGDQDGAEAAAGNYTFTVFPAGEASPFFAGSDLAVTAGTQHLAYVVGAEGSPKLLTFETTVGEGAADNGVAKDRIGGIDRFETAVLISQEVYPNGAPVVYLARHDEFPDSLAAKSLQDGPLLIVPRCGDLNDFPKVVEELERLDPERVVALGGNAAVCEAVLDQAVEAASR
jgi:hypothetical protein